MQTTALAPLFSPNINEIVVAFKSFFFFLFFAEFFIRLQIFCGNIFVYVPYCSFYRYVTLLGWPKACLRAFFLQFSSKYFFYFLFYYYYYSKPELLFSTPFFTQFLVKPLYVLLLELGDFHKDKCWLAFFFPIIRFCSKYPNFPLQYFYKISLPPAVTSYQP